MVEEIIRKIIMEVILRVAITRVVAAIPFLGWPVIGPVFAYFVGKFANLVADELVLMTKLGVIKLKVGSEVKDYDETVQVLHDELSKPEPDEAKIDEAKEKLKKSLHDLINMGPK